MNRLNYKTGKYPRQTKTHDHETSSNCAHAHNGSGHAHARECCTKGTFELALFSVFRREAAASGGQENVSPVLYIVQFPIWISIRR